MDLRIAFRVPFAWDGDPALGELPVDGWDGAISCSVRDRQTGRKPNIVSAFGDHRSHGPAGHRPCRARCWRR